MKEKINNFHIKYPFVESIFIFISGISIGFFLDLFVGDLSSTHSNDWRIVDSKYLWISITIVAVVVIYYWKFGAYSIRKQMKISDIASDEIIKAITKESIKNPRRKQRGIEDLSLKDLRTRGNKSPAPPVEPPQGAGN